MEDLSAQRCRELLDTERVGHLGVISQGEPYVTPMSFVHLDGIIYFRTGPGRRVDALEASPRACMEVSTSDPDTGAWESVVVWGDARRVEDPQEGSEVVAGLLRKYRRYTGSPLGFSIHEPLPELEVVIALPIDEMSGRGSGHGFEPGIRPGRL